MPALPRAPTSHLAVGLSPAPWREILPTAGRILTVDPDEGRSPSRRRLPSAPTWPGVPGRWSSCYPRRPMRPGLAGLICASASIGRRAYPWIGSGAASIGGVEGNRAPPTVGRQKRMERHMFGSLSARVRWVGVAAVIVFMLVVAAPGALAQPPTAAGPA